MKNVLLPIAVLVTLLGGCKDSSVVESASMDKDGVPKITNFDWPIVDGVTMRGDEFVKKYCLVKYTNETCNTVKLHEQKSSRSGRPPKP